MWCNVWKISTYITCKWKLICLAFAFARFFANLKKTGGFSDVHFQLTVAGRLKVSRDAEYRKFVLVSSSFKKILTPSATETDRVNWSLKVIRLPF